MENRIIVRYGKKNQNPQDMKCKNCSMEYNVVYNNLGELPEYCPFCGSNNIVILKNNPDIIVN